MGATRRSLLLAAANAGLVIGAGTLLDGTGEQASDAGEKGKKDKGKKGNGNPAEDVSATEDLMREHGVLNRILLIYEEGLRRMHARDQLSHDVFRRPAQLVRRFVEDYHERLEERFIFPEFERADRQMPLVRVLRQQHQGGRDLTDIVLRIAVADQFGRPERRLELTRAVHEFIRMYRPHEAREDTVLFPALHDVVSAARMRELGEQFEQEEDRLFGEGGFQTIVGQVADIERDLGIHELAQFTPPPIVR